MKSSIMTKAFDPASLAQSWPKPSRPRPIVTFGAGSIVGDAHFPAYRKAGFPIAGLYDPDQTKARALAETWGVTAFRSMEEAATIKDAIFDLATPPGRHAAGDVWRYWKDPADTIPLGTTTLLARTDLVRGAPMGGLVQGEDYCALAVTCLAPGIVLPVPVYRYRKHAGQMTAQDSYDQLEARARAFAHRFGVSLRAASLSLRESTSATA